jgi:hypothetical protein
MNSKDLVGLITVIVILGAIFVPLLALFGYMFFNYFRRKSIQKSLLASNNQLASTSHHHFVRYSSEAKFKSFLKFFPWNGAGVLFCRPGQIVFVGKTISGKPLQLEFNPTNSRPNWKGMDFLLNGAVTWFDFDTANGKHYFTSETGFFVFGSKKSTEKIALDVQASLVS